MAKYICIENIEIISAYKNIPIKIGDVVDIRCSKIRHNYTIYYINNEIIYGYSGNNEFILFYD
jgi:hypothetical protein